MSWSDVVANARPLIEHHCMHCNAVIDQDRVEFLQSTGRPCVCRDCTGESPTMALMEYGHKTAGYLVIVPRGDQHKALRAYRRNR
jgi:hypothetical protein